MNRILCIALFFGLFLAGCASKKKIAHTAETVSIATAKSELQRVETITVTDTTRVERGRITVTEVEFFPVDASSPVHPFPPAIKSFRQTVIERETERRGESMEATSETVTIDETAAMKSETVSTIEVEPAADPKRWRYVFYILVFGVGVLAYLKWGKVFK